MSVPAQQPRKNLKHQSGKVENFAPNFIYALTMTGALAALMSTADSQILPVSNILAKDFFKTKNAITTGKIPVLTSLITGEITVVGIFFQIIPTIGIADKVAAMSVSFYSFPAL